MDKDKDKVIQEVEKMLSLHQQIEQAVSEGEQAEQEHIRVDRSTWDAGEWDLEPDWRQWQHEGLECCIVRNPNMGMWLGYVGVPVTHPWWGKPYRDVEEWVSVHGGLTYSDSRWPMKDVPPEPFMQKPDKGLWWFGFDFGHAFDKFPNPVFNGYGLVTDTLEKIMEMFGMPQIKESVMNKALDSARSHTTYKNLEAAVKETNILADQLAAIGKGIEEEEQ